jgi:hypothetical protein
VSPEMVLILMPFCEALISLLEKRIVSTVLSERPPTEPRERSVWEMGLEGRFFLLTD